jgi:hypothetical protein
MRREQAVRPDYFHPTSTYFHYFRQRPYLVPKTRYLGGLVMLAYLGGAVATHLHAEDGRGVVPITIGIIAWLGLFLRDRKLRALVPVVDE